MDSSPEPTTKRSTGTHRVNMADVARLAGVSVMTVSGAFRDPGDKYPVAEETRRRVLEAAQKLGYRPHGMARAMRRKSFGNIGYLVVKRPRYLVVVPELLSGVFDGLVAHGKHLTFIGLPPDFEPKRDILPRSFQEETVDSLIVDGTIGFPHEIRAVLARSELLTVNLNLQAEFNSVWVDDYAAAQELTRHVLAKGHRSIAFLHFAQRYHDQHYSFAARRAGIADTLREAGLPFVEHALDDRPRGYRQAEQVLSAPGRAQVMMCYSDMDAAILLRAVTNLGLRVPTDVAITGFNGGHRQGQSPWATAAVALTTMGLPWYEMGYAAAEMAVTLTMQRHEPRIPSVRMMAELVEGKSV